MKNKDWEKQFDKNWEVDYLGLGKWSGSSTGGNPHYDKNKIKSFIKKALSQQRKDIVEKIEKMKKKVYAIGDVGDSNDHNTYYDMALDDVISLLKKYEKTKRT